MSQLRIKRSLEYKSRVRQYALELSTRYRVEIADAFLARVSEVEALVSENNYAGVEVPYELARQHVVLREIYFNSGPAHYCLIYEVTDEYIGFIALWHSSGSRSSGTLRRIREK